MLAQPAALPENQPASQPASLCGQLRRCCLSNAGSLFLRLNFFVPAGGSGPDEPLELWTPGVRAVPRSPGRKLFLLQVCGPIIHPAPPGAMQS